LCDEKGSNLTIRNNRTDKASFRTFDESPGKYSTLFVPNKDDGHHIPTLFSAFKNS
jgi:hypothetical protein